MTQTPAFSLVLALYQLTWMLIQVIYQLIDAIQAINSFIFLSYMESHQVGTIQDLHWLTLAFYRKYTFSTQEWSILSLNIGEELDPMPHFHVEL